MRTVSCGVWFLLCVASSYHVAGLTEHKVHNIVLYPDKHSWCKTTEIKQIVAYPGCNSIEIDNNVCVGACFSYSIPRTIPSAPGEVIIPYCDSCQPVDFEWREVTLTCSDESGEEENQTELTKLVQVITNCSCTSCEKQCKEKKASDHQRHTGSKSSDDVPELMSLMMGVHHRRPQGKDSEEEEEPARNVDDSLLEKENENSIKENEKENLIEVEEDTDGKRLKAKLDKESMTLEILNLKKHPNDSSKLEDSMDTAKSDQKRQKLGLHHPLIMKPHNEYDGHPVLGVQSHDKKSHEDKKTPSLLKNQEQENKEYLDQIALKSKRKEVHYEKVLSVPGRIHNLSSKDSNCEPEKAKTGVRMLEVPHHHLLPAVEGVEVSYFGKNEPKEEKLRDEE